MIGDGDDDGSFDERPYAVNCHMMNNEDGDLESSNVQCECDSMISKRLLLKKLYTRLLDLHVRHDSEGRVGVGPIFG
jgi:hypothetical protein